MRNVSSDKDKNKIKVKLKNKNKYKDKSTNSSRNSNDDPLKEEVAPSFRYEECVDRAFRIPIFLSTTNTLNPIQQQFQDRLIFEIENALLFPRTLPISEQYPENILTSIRRLVSSSYGMLAINFRRFLVEVTDTNVGQPSSSPPFWEGSTFLQIEPSMAFQFGLPILLVREDNTDQNIGIWAGGITPLNTFIVWDSENESVEEFFSSVQWREAFANWCAEVRNGYYNQTEPKFKYRC
ncbi:hypothetical protein [Bacillus sp. mrc49]|uniref:hypothetical protein n=1 Tax=Bacillus sp. mrc49 TaxID=2054913 RepID=UPI000C27968B|nr:hypothetical protein CVN76_22295 [Bacillus sp. mrc49]